ncbi:DUF1385 domain-containing protein [Anaerovorax odorimutans]|uniref:DUF1385 domain-containing protein n=1 Tax=Anaerovorax odorimutans TaxID=109327 RepID=A0ABT1RT23_9FIRM|nr:DUF1385 domain-containing protein [Anaerovorax odorimutans]MCQ4638327.1 DUF1385 domain-containing protein [Anaerovorax odorimutans]
MDLKRIFVKDACPTKVGGQAVLDGIMMKGEDRTAVAVRFPNKDIHIKTEKLKKPAKWMKIPIIRGVGVFVSSLVTGTRTLMYSAEVLESYDGPDAVEYEDDKLSLWLEKRFGEKGAWNVMLYASVVIALLLTVGIFIIMPTAAVNWLGHFTSSGVVLNLVEGVLRIMLFIIYVLAISKMPDIQNVFRYHGAEHKCIHCFENGLELTPDNCQGFYTLHPRCGTSFLMFVMVISLVLFSLLGWPNLFWRIASRLLLIPVIAGLSYELLRWAGRSDNWLVKVLSLPGLYLQKLTTAEPDKEQLEVAIAAMKAVMVDPDTPCYEGLCDKDGKPLAKEEPETQENSEKEKKDDDTCL